MLDDCIIKAMRDGKSRLASVRLLVLGASTRGKTSTVASLRRHAFEENRLSTHGIKLHICYVVPGKQDVDGLLEGKAGDGKLEMTLRARDMFQEKLRQYLQYQHMLTRYRPVSLDNGASKIANFDEDFEDIPSEDDLHESIMNRVPTSLYDPGKPCLNTAVTLRIWDFGGQQGYEPAHQLYISPRSISMIVFDLQRFEDLRTKEEQVSEVYYWLRAVFALTGGDGEGNASLLVVGTRRDSCRHPKMADVYCRELRNLLTSKLTDRLCQKWNLCQLKIIAIENKTAIHQVRESGLAQLEEELGSEALCLVNRSLSVPLRWLAFIEMLKEENEKRGGLFLEGSVVEEAMGGFKFPLVRKKREDELRSLLLYFRDLGELIIFKPLERKSPNKLSRYVVFLEPEKILKALAVIIAPEAIRCGGLRTKTEIGLMHSGLLNMGILRTKWEPLNGLSSEHERRMLVEVLTSMDIFVKLKDSVPFERNNMSSSGDNILLGIPALLRTGWKDWEWLKPDGGQVEVSSVTLFDDFMPFGIIGTLIARLHRTIGQEATNVRFVRANAVLLTLDHSIPGSSVTQVFAGFDFDNRELHWKVRSGRFNFEVLGQCLQELEEHMLEISQTARFPGYAHKHFFVATCPSDSGCGELNFRLMFPVPNIPRRDMAAVTDSWWGKANATLQDVSSMCQQSICDNDNCCRCWTLAHAMGKDSASIVPGPCHAGIPTPFVVFISHAGEDKEWAMYLTDALERRGMRTFLDRRELQGHSQRVSERLEAALRQATVGVFLLSIEFYGKKWTVRELRHFVERKEAGGEDGESVVLYPIFDRLKYVDARRGDLYKQVDHFHILLQNGFFDDDRQEEHSMTQTARTFRQLCQYSGLEQGDKELRTKMQGERPLLYLLVYLLRVIYWILGIRSEDWELGGVLRHQFFDCAAERIERAYRQSQDSLPHSG